MNSILITRPEHDHGTRYLSRWSEHVIEAAKKKGIKVIDLHKEKATRVGFEGRVRKICPSFVLMHGHGSASSIAGHDNEALVALGENEQTLYNCITYAVSCDSAAELGSAVVEKGSATYIGYTKSFWNLAQEASERSKSAFRKTLRTLLSSKDNDQYAKEDIKDLYWDMVHQVCLGDGNATL